MNDIKDKIESEVQTILNYKFNDRARRKIKKFQDRLNFCCPICGDSIDDITKKRGNIYFSNMRYICFNCNYSTTVDKFLRSFDTSLSLDEIEVIHDLSNSKKQVKSVNDDYWLFQLLDKLSIPVGVLKKQLGLVDCYNFQYLIDRCIPKNKFKHFLYNPKTNELLVLNLNQNNNVIGFQVRQLNELSKKPKYMSYNISKIYNNYLLKGKTFNEFLTSKFKLEDIDYIIDKLNTISLIFNILNVDICKHLNIVEGPIDSFFINNCIALCGASRLSNYFDELEDVYYIFDNDETGREHAFEKLNNGKYVFLWNKEHYGKVKDVNDLVKSGFTISDVFNEGNFSNSELDAIYI